MCKDFDPINVTPEMVAAGVAYFERANEGRFPPNWDLADVWVTALFQEMARAAIQEDQRK